MCVCVPMPTHCTIMCFGFRTRRIDGVKCDLFSIHAPLGQTTLRKRRVSVQCTYFCNSLQQIGNWFICEVFDLAVECMKWLPDVYRGESYDFKNKQNDLPISPTFMQGYLQPISHAFGTIRVKLNGLFSKLTISVKNPTLT